jgi:hypothetical protein
MVRSTSNIKSKWDLFFNAIMISEFSGMIRNYHAKLPKKDIFE